MLRKILTPVCLLEVLAPEALIETAERIALDDPEACDIESWVVPGARIEGLAFLLAMWRSDRSYSTFKKFLGAVGLLALASPRTYVDYGAKLAYDDATECEWKPWVYPGTRLVGALYVLVALDELRNDAVLR